MAGIKPNNKSSPGPIGNTQGLIVPKTSPNASGENNSAPPPEPQPKEEGWWKSWGSNLTHNVLDVVGLIPVVGEVCDGANALIYAAEGDMVNAALSAAAMLPVGGQAATAAKFAKKAATAAAEQLGKKAAKETAQAVAKQAEKKAAKELEEAAAKKAAKELEEAAAKKAAKPKGGIVEGNVRPKQEHHYATNKNKKYSPAMQRIAEKYKLDLNEVWNKEFLPHQGRHPNAYHDFVIDGMKQADKIAKGDKSKFLELFESYVKKPVRENPDLLRKKGWE